MCALRILSALLLLLLVCVLNFSGCELIAWKEILVFEFYHPITCIEGNVESWPWATFQFTNDLRKSHRHILLEKITIGLFL